MLDKEEIYLYILLGLLTAKSWISWDSKSCFPMDIYFVTLLCFSKWKLRSEIRWWFISILASQSVNIVKVMLNLWIKPFRPRIPPRTNFGNILWDCCRDDVLKAGPSTFYVRDLYKLIKIVATKMWLDLWKPSLSAQEMKPNLLLIIKPTLLHYLKIPNT